MEEATFPARPLIGLLLRLLYQNYSQDIHAALLEAESGETLLDFTGLVDLICILEMTENELRA